MKTCPHCQENKELSFFGKNKNSKDGFSRLCSECKRQYQKDYHKKNPSKYPMYGKKWRESNKEKKKEIDRNWLENNRDKSNIIKKRWKIKHKAQNADINKRYYQKNSVAKNAYSAQWLKENLEKRRLSEHRRRARKLGNGVYSVSDMELKKLMRRPCFYCGGVSKHIDHIIPISRGGRHSIGNLIQACMYCNISKSNKFIIEWRTQNARRR